MIHPTIRREIAERYHAALPNEIRTCLRDRGIPATVIERHRLGWNGTQVTIPVFGWDGEVLGLRYAKVSDDPTEKPEIVSELGLGPELYGWDTVKRVPHRVVICASEFDRLVLEANGFAAVSTAGTPPFPETWLPRFAPIKHVYVCFDRDLAGAAAAKEVQRVLPRARLVTLPPEVAQNGTVTDFFVTLGRTAVDFEVLLASAAGDRRDESPTIHPIQPHEKSLKRRADGVRRAVRLHEIAANYVELQASDARLTGQCPFHDDAARSFSVYPQTDTYRCDVCGSEGDIVRFLMDKESMTIGQALDALERFRYIHELFGTS